MKILVLGSNGQVGHHLLATLAPLGDVIGLDRSMLDLTDGGAIAATIERFAPRVIVNAAAYTAVDQAETDVELAACVNGSAVGFIAAAASKCKALLIHYSTDYVFDGKKATPYVEDDPVNPINVYGQTKLAGENAIRQQHNEAIILRTTWVYAAHGKNFVKTILRLAAERDELRVIADQIGAPTSALALARATARIVEQALPLQAGACLQSSTYHLTGAGETSWHGLASEVVSHWRAIAGERSLRARNIVPIPTSEYVTAAARPHNSRLSNQRIREVFGIELPAWQQSLHECLASINALQQATTDAP